MNIENELSRRLFNFAIRVIKYLRTLPNSAEYSIIKYQLIKSATSSGANYKEAQSGYSRADFNHKVNTALKEMSESNYWLNIIEGIIEINNNSDELDFLINESSELEKILGKISFKTKK